MMPVDVVLFEVHGRRFALPVAAVREVFPLASVTQIPTAPPAVRGLAALHGQVLPLLDLGAWLQPGGSGAAAANRGSEEAIAFEAALPGETSSVRAALAVDRVLHLGTVEAPAARSPGTPAIVAGTVAEAGGPALLVDPSAVLGAAQQAVQAAAREAFSP